MHTDKPRQPKSPRIKAVLRVLAQLLLNLIPFARFNHLLRFFFGSDNGADDGEQIFGLLGLGVVNPEVVVEECDGRGKAGWVGER